MSRIPFEIKVEGISGYDPLYLPVEVESDIRVGHTEPTADKIGNDENKDVSVFLSTWDMLQDLSRGAWFKNKLMDAAK
jgi:hypothetical protein